MELKPTDPYANNSDYTLVKKSAPFEVKDRATGIVFYGRTFEYRTKCSLGKCIGAILLAIVTLGLVLIVKTVREACMKRKIEKINVAMTQAEVQRFFNPPPFGPLGVFPEDPQTREFNLNLQRQQFAPPEMGDLFPRGTQIGEFSANSLSQTQRDGILT